MKTLDEAMAIVSGDNFSEDHERLKVASDHLLKYRDLLDQVAAHPKVHETVLAIYSLVESGQMDPRSGLLTAFCNGTRLGIEMEKSE